MSASSLLRMRKIAYVCLFVSGLSAQTRPACKPPPELTSRLSGKNPARAWNVQGAWFAKQHNTACAISSFQSALKADPNLLEARFNLGLALSEHHQPERAVQEFRALLARKPDFALAHNALGVV